MTPKEFIKLLRPFALECEKETGIDANVILAQSAQETGWGRYAPGNMYFGVKDIDGINGNEQLVITHEYSSKPNLTPKQIGLNDIMSIRPVNINGKPFFKYVGHAYFRKYVSPKDSFVDHAKLFLRAKVYAKALTVKNQPLLFIDEMAKHYAQDPNYANALKKLYNQIKNL